MRKQLVSRMLSVALSAAIMMSAGAGFGLMARASETTGEGTTAAGQEMSADDEDSIGNAEDSFGNAAQPSEDADLGATGLSEEISNEISDEQLAQDIADAAEDMLQFPSDSGAAEMDKSAIGAVFDNTYLFDDENAIVYVTEATAVRAEPFDEAEAIAQLDKYASVLLTGSNSLQYWEVTIDGGIGYLDSSMITRDPDVIEAMKEDDLRKEETEAQSRQEQEESIAEKAAEGKEEWEQALKESRRSELANQTRSYYWDGPVLNRRNGSVYGPSGKETYYNLNMSGCVRNMNRRGYYYDVWVRNDGVKMFGDYIMCAANLSVHPFGSLVECSLGTCIVVDTGGFAAGNPNQLDIAVTW